MLASPTVLPPLLWIAACLGGPAELASAASGTGPQWDLVARMGRGINIGNTMDARCGEGCWMDQIEEHYFADYKAAGLGHVRIPITWSHYMSQTGQVAGTWRSAADGSTMNFLDRVEVVVDWGLAAGLVVIINAHHDDWLCASYDEPNKARFATLWAAIAERFKSHSLDLVFEVLNEPYYTKFTPAQASGPVFPYPEWETTNQDRVCSSAEITDLNLRTRAAIRASGGLNAGRFVVVTGSSNPRQPRLYADHIVDHIDIEQLLPDDRVLATFHYYKADPAAIDADFAAVAEWSIAHDVPILLGEFGQNNGVDEAVSTEWYATLYAAADRCGFAATAWDTGSAATTTGGFLVYNREASGDWTTKFDRGKLAAVPSSLAPTVAPTETPATRIPTKEPTESPTSRPSPDSTVAPITARPTTPSAAPASSATPDPSAAPTGTPTDTTAGGVKPDESCVALYKQCDGRSYNGERSCCGSAYCRYGNPWYSQCVPGAATSSLPTTVTQLRASTQAPTATPSQPPTSPPAAPQQCAARFSQCGGRKHDGPTTCCGSDTCRYRGPYYSQCVAPNRARRLDRVTLTAIVPGLLGGKLQASDGIQLDERGTRELNANVAHDLGGAGTVVRGGSEAGSTSGALSAPAIVTITLAVGVVFVVTVLAGVAMVRRQRQINGAEDECLTSPDHL